MRNQRQVVDYALRRKALLASFHAGRVTSAEICDAGPYLRRAAKFHGEATEHRCPVCRKDNVALVGWVFGDELKHASGSARRPDELERMADLFSEFSVHVVEVCASCGWNHLALSYVAGTGRQSSGPGRPRTRRTAAP